MTVHNSKGQAAPFDYSVVGKDGTGDCFFWTTEPPTAEGWYWCYFPNASDPFSCLPILFDSNNEPWVDSDDRWQLQFVSHWLGPLPVPAPPTEGE